MTKPYAADGEHVLNIPTVYKLAMDRLERCQAVKDADRALVRKMGKPVTGLAFSLRVVTRGQSNG